jgi:hypothetical protein
VKKEPQVKEDPQEKPALEEDEKPWWMKELALENAARHPEDPTDVSGLHLLQARLYSEAQPMDEAMAILWSAQESGNLIDLSSDDDVMSKVKKEV